MQDSVKRIIFYFSCGFVILSVLFLIIGQITNHKSLLITSYESDNLNYNPEQIRSFSQKNLTALYQASPKQTYESKKYQTTKDKNYQKLILTNALERNDFNTLIAICKKDPTNLNKAYVYACSWNIKYDEYHMINYAKCLLYYRDHLTNKEKDQISPPLHRVIKSCIKDPTGK